ncbi:ATP-binding protein [Abyssalbus ytuae]|uniref:histidine kinase n=1 Tax=Abyssalbus ytuae TaxID=2926907 RepID=A0A9E6ZLR2_9FLAO|nr:ATP-binding protein [Abyssalbus ytuae]UOB16954.1 ATP-binding protein [Abyssalbus ytuae]
MIVNSAKASNKVNLIIFIIAVTLLLFIAGISYKQSESFRESSGLVSHTYEVSMEINHMFSLFSLLESDELNYLISKDSAYLKTIETDKVEIEQSLVRIDSLTGYDKIQQKNIDSINKIKNKFYETLRYINFNIFTEEIDQSYVDNEIASINKYMEKISNQTDLMIAEEQRLLKERKEEYVEDSWFTPILSLVMGTFALLVMALAFYKINQDRKQIIDTQSFLQNILKTTNNVISYFEPVYNEEEEIVDFEIIYTNELIEDVTGDVALEIQGKKISEVYPFLFENGVFEIFKECIEKDKRIEYERLFVFNGKKMWFYNAAVKLGDGLTLTSHDVTKETVIKNELLDLNERLEIQNTVLKAAKAIAKIGSYEWRLDENKIRFSENLYKMLGYEPEQLLSSYKNLLLVIHPEDRKKFKKRLLKVKNKKVFKEYTFRVLNKNKKVRYFKFTGSFIDTLNKNIFLGVVQDVTVLLEDEKILKNKNQELKRTNAELESFNRVASHDLQEPLRKIQIFISRIYDSEYTSLSEKSKGYFDKISSSAERMRKLITYLLTYSRISKPESVFEKTNLNNVLQRVKEYLAEIISDNDLVINSENLPVVHGITFQMEQIFSNIISNSVKYKRKGIKPVISITAELVEKQEVPELAGLNPSYSEYYKISFEDNGIGFNQEHSQIIFELFQRLHGKNEYGGTGIGLTICKKIVENHHGYIGANGKPGEGAVFYFYLPVV